MTDTTNVAPQQQVVEEWQVQLSRAIGMLIFGFNGISVLIGVLFQRAHPSLRILITPVWVALGISSLCCWWVLYEAHAGRRRLIPALVVTASIATTLAVYSSSLAWQSGDVVGWYLLAFGLCLVLAGILGDAHLLLSTTIVCNIFTCLVTLIPSFVVGRAFEPQQLLLSGALLWQWLLFALLHAVQHHFQILQRLLASSRLEVERTRQTDEMKDQFITNVNHELRNPVMAIMGYLSLLAYSELEPQAAEDVAKANQAGNILLAIINSVLEVRSFEQHATDFTIDIITLRDVIAEAATTVGPLEGATKKRHLQITIAPEIVVWGNRVRLQQVFSNLLTNAMKYSPAGSSIEIGATIVTDEALQRPHDMVEVTVRDYGFGIPPEHIPLLFQRFARLPRDLASTISGTGVGLYLARILVEQMAGRIWVESSGIHGEGSIFYVRLLVPPHIVRSRSKVGDEYTQKEV